MTLSLEVTRDISACQAVRAKVFIDEQGVSLAEEVDGLDDQATHVLARVDGEPVGTARLLVKDDTGKIGRVAVVAELRGTGLGKKLMYAVEDEAKRLNLSQLKLGSQVTAISFYEKLGYECQGPEFMDAGIPHRMMVRRL